MATSWRTAHYLGGVSIPESGKYYFIQGLETWSGTFEHEQLVLRTWKSGMTNIVVSQWLKNKADDLGVQSEVVPNFIDTVKFPLGPDSEMRELDVLFIYSSHPVKRAELAIETAWRLHGLNPSLKIACFGTEKRPPDLPSYVQHFVNPSPDEIGELYRKSKLFMVTSISEGWCLPALEAMSSGTVVVSSKNGGVQSYASDVAIFPLEESAEHFSSTILSLLDELSTTRYMERVAKGLELALLYSKTKSLELLRSALELHSPLQKATGRAFQIRKTLTRLLSKCLRFLFLLVPTSRAAFVYGGSPVEGNAVAIVEALLKETSMRIVWLEGPGLDFLNSRGMKGLDRITFISRKRSPQAIWRFLRSKLVFTSTELYGMPSPLGDRIIINLWHGEGPKGGEFFPFRKDHRPSSNYLVGTSTLLRLDRAKQAGVSADSVLMTGMPRVDLLKSRRSRGTLARLGLEGELPIVLWMPTFRRARSPQGKLAWTDTTEFGAEMWSNLINSKEFEEFATESTDFQFIAKTHHLDFDVSEYRKFRTLTDLDLLRSGITVNELLSQSSILITDYSSVWLEYLYLNRPIGFFIPDEAEYWARRPKDGNFDHVGIPGPTIGSVNDLRKFVSESLVHPAAGNAIREAVFSSLGLVESENHSLELLRALSLTETPLSIKAADHK